LTKEYNRRRELKEKKMQRLKLNYKLKQLSKYRMLQLLRDSHRQMIKDRKRVLWGDSKITSLGKRLKKTVTEKMLKLLHLQLKLEMKIRNLQERRLNFRFLPCQRAVKFLLK
jgi:CRISPR/Cas system-associated protein endoribonuclease Cas2